MGAPEPGGRIEVRVLTAKTYRELFKYLAELPDELVVNRIEFSHYLTPVVRKLLSYARSVSEKLRVGGWRSGGLGQALDTLNALFTGPKTVILEGPPGIGKTRAVADLITGYMSTQWLQGFSGRPITHIAYFAPTYKLIGSVVEEIKSVFTTVGERRKPECLGIVYGSIYMCPLKRDLVELTLKLLGIPRGVCRHCEYRLPLDAIGKPTRALGRARGKDERERLERLLRAVHAALARRLGSGEPIVPARFRVAFRDGGSREEFSVCLKDVLVWNMIIVTTRRRVEPLYVWDDFGYFREYAGLAINGARLFRVFLASQSMLKTLPYLEHVVNSERPNRVVLWVFDEADRFYTSGFNILLERPTLEGKEAELLDKYRLRNPIETLVRIVFERFRGTYTLPYDYDRLEPMIESFESIAGEDWFKEAVEEAKNEALSKHVPFRSYGFIASMWSLVRALRKERDYAVLEIKSGRARFLNVSLTTEALLNPTLPARYNDKLIFSATFRPVYRTLMEYYGGEISRPRSWRDKQFVFIHYSVNYRYSGLRLVIHELEKLVLYPPQKALVGRAGSYLGMLSDLRASGKIGWHELVVRLAPAAIMALVYRVHKMLRDMLDNPLARTLLITRVRHVYDLDTLLAGNLVVWFNSKKTVKAFLEMVRVEVPSCRVPAGAEKQLEEGDGVEIVCADEKGRSFKLMLSWYRSRLSRGISYLEHHYIGSVAVLPAYKPPGEGFIDTVEARSKTAEVVQALFRVVRRPVLGAAVIAFPKSVLDAVEEIGYGWNLKACGEELHYLYVRQMLRDLQFYSERLGWKLNPFEESLIT